MRTYTDSANTRSAIIMQLHFVAVVEQHDHLSVRCAVRGQFQRLAYFLESAQLSVKNDRIVRARLQGVVDLKPHAGDSIWLAVGKGEEVNAND